MTNSEMCSSCDNDARLQINFFAHDIENSEEKTMVSYYCEKCYPIALKRYLDRIREWFE